MSPATGWRERGDSVPQRPSVVKERGPAAKLWACPRPDLAYTGQGRSARMALRPSVGLGPLRVADGGYHDGEILDQSPDGRFCRTACSAGAMIIGRTAITP